MAFDDGLVTLLERNHSILSGKKVLLVGDISSVSVLSELKDTAQAYVITDNYDLARRMSSMIGEKIGNSSFEVATKKHITICFSTIDDPRIKEIVSELDLAVIFLCKSKKLTQNILFNLNSLIQSETKFLILGSNAIGGKSADSLVKKVAKVFKLDMARKCTLFSATLNEGAQFEPIAKTKPLNYQGLTLEQHHGVFSQGEVDLGTSMLLEAVNQEVTQNTDLLAGNILDLGCGSGIVGLSLKQAGAQCVVCSDISATALKCTELNAKLNNLEVHTLACNMLPQAQDLDRQGLAIKEGRFDVIVTNPPFHEGVNRNMNPTLNMIANAKNSLTKNGVLYLVGNTNLHYELALNEAFNHVQILKSTTKFTVFKAQNLE